MPREVWETHWSPTDTLWLVHLLPPVPHRLCWPLLSTLPPLKFSLDLDTNLLVLLWTLQLQPLCLSLWLLPLSTLDLLVFTPLLPLWQPTLLLYHHPQVQLPQKSRVSSQLEPRTTGGISLRTTSSLDSPTLDLVEELPAPPHADGGSTTHMKCQPQLWENLTQLLLSTCNWAHNLLPSTCGLITPWPTPSVLSCWPD